MWVDACVCAVNNRRAGLDCFMEVGTLSRTGLTLFLQLFLQNARTGAFTKDVLGNVDIHRQRRVVFDGEPYSFVVNESRMLNRVSACLERVDNALGAMRMGGHFQASTVRFINQSSELFKLSLIHI